MNTHSENHAEGSSPEHYSSIAPIGSSLQKNTKKANSYNPLDIAYNPFDSENEEDIELNVIHERSIKSDTEHQDYNNDAEPTNHNEPEAVEASASDNNLPQEEELPALQAVDHVDDSEPTNHNKPEAVEASASDNDLPQEEELPALQAVDHVDDAEPTNHNEPEAVEASASDNNLPQEEELPALQAVDHVDDAEPTNHNEPETVEASASDNNLPQEEELPALQAVDHVDDAEPTNHNEPEAVEASAFDNDLPQEEELPALQAVDHVDDSEPTPDIETEQELALVNDEDKEKLSTTKTEQHQDQHGEKQNIEEELLNNKIISKDQLMIAQKIQREKHTSKMIGTILVELGFITDKTLHNAISSRNKIDNLNLKNTVLDLNLITKIPKNLAIRNKVIPISLKDNSLYVATPDIYDILVLDKIKKYFPQEYKIHLIYAAESDISEALDKYHGYEMSIHGILKEIEDASQNKKKIIDGTDTSYTSPTVRLVDAILIDAARKRASDIHLEPEKAFIRLRYRIDGQLLQICSFHKNYWSAVVVRIKIMSGLNIAETRTPQDGSIGYNISGNEIDIRVASHPTIYGENVVLRILDKKQSLLSIEELGFSERNQKLLKKMLKKPEGIVLVTGPTGSGKTTTLYSALNYINSMSINIMTLEDPVEYRLPIIRQTSVKETAGVDFSHGIRSIMRQDPDVIFIGEIRDEKTANSAVRAAITGHQVFSTLHTNDAANSINRLLDIGIKNQMLSGALICIVAQRLARKLCDHCKEEYTPTERDLLVLGDDSIKDLKLYRHVGCDDCMNSGYKGRLVISEVLPITKALDEIIATSPLRKKILDCALNENSGFIPMIEDAAEKVMQGITDVDEMIRVVDTTERLPEE